MPWYASVALAIAVNVSAITGQEPPACPKAKVEFRWVERSKIEGVTENKGFQGNCDPRNLVYPHKKPALVLTAAEVAKVTLTKSDLSKVGLSSEQYMVKLHLTKKARDRLAMTVEGTKTRQLAVIVDGKCKNIYRYEKKRDKPGAPRQTWAEIFNPSVGFFSSRAEAQRLVDAVK